MTVTAEEGRVLAARWQIERTRRPAAPDLVWMGFSRPEVARFACLACGDTEPKQAVLRAAGRTLYLCGACASHLVHPPPAADIANAFEQRLAVEHDADILAAAEVAARAVAARAVAIRPPASPAALGRTGFDRVGPDRLGPDRVGLDRAGGVLLDLGCGLGFVVDIVRHLPGWTAAGVDPEPLADLGAAGLGARLRHGGPAQAAALAPQPADVVVMEGVLERSSDPLALLRALPALSVPRATWLIATIDAATIYQLDEPSALLRLLHTRRTMLPSAPGLRALLHRSGDMALATAAIARTPDHQLRVAVRTPPAAAAEISAPQLLDRYFAARLASALPGPSFDLALRLAALAHAVARRHGPDARIILTALDAKLHDAAEAARARAQHASLPALLAAAPACAGPLLLLAGLAALLDPADDALARTRLDLAQGLCRRAYALAPLAMQAEHDLAERADRVLADLDAARRAA